MFKGGQLVFRLHIGRQSGNKTLLGAGHRRRAGSVGKAPSRDIGDKRVANGAVRGRGGRGGGGSAVKIGLFESGIRVLLCRLNAVGLQVITYLRQGFCQRDGLRRGGGTLDTLLELAQSVGELHHTTGKLASPTGKLARSVTRLIQPVGQRRISLRKLLDAISERS